MAAPPPPYQGIQMPAFPAGLPPPSFPPQAGGFYQAQPAPAPQATAPEQALAQMQLQQQQMQIIQQQPAEAAPAPAGQQQAPTRLEENRPPPLSTNPTPVRRGLFNFFRRGNTNDASQQAAGAAGAAAAGAPDPNDPDAAAAQLGPSASRAGSQAGSQGGAPGAGTEGGAGAAPGAGGQPQGPGIMQKEERDALQVAMVSYDNSYKLQEEAPAVTAAIVLHFDTGRITGAPAPLPSRLTAQHEGRFAREELGLYRENQCVLSENSLNKTEQRIAKAATLDRALLAEMAGGNAAAGGQQVAIMAQRQAVRAQEVQTQQLQVGALPTLTEEPEGQEGQLAQPPPGEQPLQSPLPPGAGSPPHGQQLQPRQQPPMTPGGPTLPMPPGPGGSPPIMAAAQLPLSPGAEAAAIAAAGGALTPEQQAAMQLHHQQQQQLAAQGMLPPGAQGDPAAMAAMMAAGGGGGGVDPMAMAVAAAAAGAPATTAIQDPLFAYQWLDENGLMVYVPDPTKRDKERPARRYDQDKEMTRTYVRRPVVDAVAGAGGRGGRGESRLYRLDIELGRLEFGVHPAMSQEDLLAARLMALFREYKKREAVGLVLFYAGRLAALEDSLLGAREKLFALQATEAAADDVLDAYALLGKIEREVAELRQLKEEEEALLTRTVRAMERQFEALRGIRQQQGYALTNLELTVLTRPPLEMSWKQGVLTRERLDVLLVTAELEDIAGLPRFPDPLPVPDLADLPLPRVNAAGLPAAAGGGFPGAFPGAPGPFGAPLAGYGALMPGGQSAAAAAMAAGEGYTFRLRRVESMCAAHSALLAEAVARLDALKNRPSADPEDPVLKALEDQVALLGRAPRRVAMMAEDSLELQRRATEMVKAGQVHVSRLPHLVPVLTINPTGAAGGHLPPAAQQQLAYMQLQQQGQQQGQQMVMTPQGLMPAPGQQQLGPGQQLTGAGPQGQHMGGPMGNQPKTLGKQGSKGRYYVKLFVNHKFVDQSDVATLAENFSGDFKDLFSVQVSHFPESILVQLYERHALRDYFVAQVYVAVPGVSGTPHVDATPRPYQFTSLTAFRTRGPNTSNPNGGGLSGAMPLMPSDTGRPDGAPGAFATVFPAGTLYVRCGWVSQRVAAGASLEETVVPKAMTTYDNPLADRGREEGPLGTWAGQPGSGVVGAPDIESGRSLMPPLPSVPVDRMLRRAAERIGGKANRAQIMRWLADNVIDPNDPRNAPLLELLKTHEAASGALGDLFRLDIFPDVAMKDDRVADKRMSVLARRWQAGIYRAPDKNLLKGVRSVPLRAPLTSEETSQLDSQYLDQLALLEEAADGTQLGLARVMMARHEKAMQVQIGARLTNAIKEREERIRAFAIRVRAAAARLAGGRTMARRFRTEDVVNDAPLPQFKLELGAIAQLLAPRRPLKRSKKLVKSLMTSVPRETQLMVTIQRAASLPARMARSAVGGTDDKRLRRGAGVDRRRGGRSGGDGGDEGGGGGGGLPSGAPDRLSQQRNCFVEVRFRSLSQRTIAVPGEFPIFNEEIDLDVFRDDGRDTQQAGPEDGSALEPSPSALQENSDLITFNVFDEIIVEPSEPITLRRRDAEISDPVRLPERERRFLGCVRVPLSAVYQMQVLEGTFKLEAPPVVLGYVQTSQRPSTVSIYMTLRPRLAAPAGEMDERITSGEQEQVNRHAQRWRAALLGRAECRSRVIKVMAVDADGAAVLVCRYVAPTLLPPSLAVNVAAGGAAVAAGGVEMLMLKLARFVAHVPYMEDSGLHKRRNDIWTSSSELLHLAGGDFEEHAHLLAGYFLQLGLQAFVVAGTSLCGARSMFVLTTGQAAAPAGQPQAPPPPLHLNAELLRLWNPITGSVVSVKDPTGEMREVGQLYDGSNIWANTQPTGRPWEMNWNLTSGRDWAPFFGAQLPPREIATIQTTPLYEELEKQFYEELEGRVEKKVEEALSQARAAGAFVTKPDNRVSRLLKNLLREMPKTSEAIAAASLAASAALAEAAGKGPLEAPQHLGERHNLITGLQASHNERIRRESKAEAVHGHVLALPFSDSYLEAVADAVLNTGIHRIADERVKFSTAVFVEPLGASFVCCVWIYVAAIRS